MNANGNLAATEAIAQAEADALAHQEAHPPVHEKPAAEPPTTPEPPTAPALYSPEWFDIQVQALDADQQQKYALWQQAIGRLDVLKQLQALTAQQQVKGEGKEG